LFVVTGAAAVGVSTRLRTQVYGRVSIGYENVVPYKSETIINTIDIHTRKRPPG
jgi:hypothetical protein